MIITDSGFYSIED